MNALGFIEGPLRTCVSLSGYQRRLILLPGPADSWDHHLLYRDVGADVGPRHHLVVQLQSLHHCFRNRPRTSMVASFRCERGEGVQGVLTLFCSGTAQVCHDDRVVELKEQLEVEEEDGDRQEEKVEEK